MEQLKNYLIEYNQKTIGVFTSLEKAQDFISGCQQNGFIHSGAVIKTFKPNSCFCECSEFFDSKITQQSHAPRPNRDGSILFESSHAPNTPSIKNINFNYSDSENNREVNKLKNNKQKVNKQEIQKQFPDQDNPVMIEMANQKIELQHKINLLKFQKKKIEESKSTFENDLKLFELFYESKQKDTNFIIPEIFDKKYYLMEKLKKENKLYWEDFIKEYQHENFYNEYFGLNSYEGSFLENDNNIDEVNEIDEVFDIESDSDTNTSDSDK